jgi:hypothetical protein
MSSCSWIKAIAPGVTSKKNQFITIYKYFPRLVVTPHLKNIHLRPLGSNLPWEELRRWTKQTQSKTRGGTTNNDEEKDGYKTSVGVLNFRTLDGI